MESVGKQEVGGGFLVPVCVVAAALCRAPLTVGLSSFNFHPLLTGLNSDPDRHMHM